MPKPSPLRTLLHRCTEPQFLFPGIAAVVLAIIWGGALVYVNMQKQGATRAAEASTRELLGTYEAQVVGALQQIDQTLDLIVWLHARPGPRSSLDELAQQDLLPPNLVFTVSTTDREGRIVESTGAVAAKPLTGLAHFERQRLPQAGVLIGKSDRAGAATGSLTFTRRLETPGGQFDGVVAVTVDAAYFVSGYETAKLGRRGLLALIGANGEIGIARRGDDVLDKGLLRATELALADDGDEVQVVQRRDASDGELRWLSARALYSLPLVVVVGLSLEEQLGAAKENGRFTLWLAAVGSALSLLLLGVLGRQSWQLTRSREREEEIQRTHAERIEYLAYHDALTDLPNRSHFSRLLGQSVAEARRYQRQLALAFVDVDRFKQINDTLGHEAGDELLKEVGRRLRNSVRSSDFVARLGGDEFVLLLPMITGGVDAVAVVNKVLAAMNQPVRIGGHDVEITVSIGISLCPRHGSDEQSLKRAADQAMYKVKESGRNGFRFYERDLNDTTVIALRPIRGPVG